METPKSPAEEKQAKDCRQFILQSENLVESWIMNHISVEWHLYSNSEGTADRIMAAALDLWHLLWSTIYHKASIEHSIEIQHSFCSHSTHHNQMHAFSTTHAANHSGLTHEALISNAFYYAYIALNNSNMGGHSRSEECSKPQGPGKADTAHKMASSIAL